MIDNNDQLDSRFEEAVHSLEDGEALMMWLVNKKTFQVSLERGVEYFESKYGLRPNVVIAHPADVVLADGTVLDAIGNLMVATAPWCLAGHALIGIISSKDSVWGVQL